MLLNTLLKKKEEEANSKRGRIWTVRTSVCSQRSPASAEQVPFLKSSGEKVGLGFTLSTAFATLGRATELNCP